MLFLIVFMEDSIASELAINTFFVSSMIFLVIFGSILKKWHIRECNS